MRGWRVHAYGHYRDVLRWEEFDTPAPPHEGALVKIAAAGLNFPDLLATSGKYQVKAPLPFVPGIEACGDIVAVGAKSRHRVGERVIANNAWGAFAEYMPVPDRGCFAFPEDMPDAHAAALHVIYQTSYFALVHRARLEPSESLLVHGGAGGVGTSAIQIGKALGATVIATAGSDEKLRVCRDCGADHVINYRDEDFVAAVKKLTAGRGADVIYDPVGGDVFDASTKCIAFSGRLLVIGFASGRIPSIQANRILLKNIAIVGLHWGNYLFHDPERIPEAHARLCDMYSAGRIRPMIYKQYPLAELPAAMADIESRASYGKIVLLPG